VVFEDTLAVNVNPERSQRDRQQQLQGRSLRLGLGTTVIATTVPSPDLTVTSRHAPPMQGAGRDIRSPSTGSSTTRARAPASGSWIDEVLVEPTGLTSYLNKNNSLRLGRVTHDGGVDSKTNYARHVDGEHCRHLAHGQYIYVQDGRRPGLWAEDDETNNAGGSATPGDAGCRSTWS